MQLRLHNLSLVLACLPVGLACLTDAFAQAAPKAEYSIKDDEARTGSHIRRDRVHGSRVAVNLPYAQLPEKDKESLHAWWTNIAPGDEPPFPARGLRELYEPLRKAHSALLDTGSLFAVVTVGPDGQAVDVKIYQAPSQRMGEFAARVLLLTEYKPAICSGVPCRMDFPLRMSFSVSAE